MSGAWVSDTAVDTGSDAPVTASCFEGLPLEDRRLYEYELPRISGADVNLASMNFLVMPNSRIRILNFFVASQLVTHYFDRTGFPVQIDFEYFSNNPSKPFLEKLYSIKVGSSDSYGFTVEDDGLSKVLALHNINFKRVSKDCFEITDRYNFEYRTKYEILKLANDIGKAKEFDVCSSGCFKTKHA